MVQPGIFYVKINGSLVFYNNGGDVLFEHRAVDFAYPGETHRSPASDHKGIGQTTTPKRPHRSVCQVNPKEGRYFSGKSSGTWISSTMPLVGLL